MLVLILVREARLTLPLTPRDDAVQALRVNMQLW